jgi:maleate isomerase
MEKGDPAFTMSPGWPPSATSSINSEVDRDRAEQPNASRMADAIIRVGVLTPHAALGPEAELPAMAPGRVVTCVARASADEVGVEAHPTTPSGPRALTTLAFLDEAAELLGQGALDVTVYASTSSGYALGLDTELVVVSRLSRRIGTPVVATCASVVLALRVLDVGRIALVHPPWFDDGLNELGAAYFQGEGFEVVSSASAALSMDPRRIEAAAVCAWTAQHVDDDAEAVFIGGNGFRAAGAIAALEDVIDRPVLTANQVLLWSLLRQADAAFQVRGYGRLFAHENGAQIQDDAGRSVSSERSGRS